MSAYKVSEEDIKAIVHNLEIYDSQNADREYAIQALEVISRMAKRVVDKGPEFTRLFLQALSKKKKEKQQEKDEQ